MKTKILITVKTYPTISGKYQESVCTVGMDENGRLIRIYPIPFRDLPFSSQYKKYDWIEIELQKNASDFRPESYSPKSLNSKIEVVSHVNTDFNWLERKNVVLKHVKYDIKELIEDAKDKRLYSSLAVFKPTEIIDFHYTEVSPNWNRKQTHILAQENLFVRKGELIRKLPYKFLYKFKDCNGVESNMMIEDWEIGELYWKCLAKHKGDNRRALDDVKYKFWNDLALTKDLFFFLGTTRLHHLTSRNPFMIIGLFYPKKEQPNLFS